eukprot:14386227-Alexandrium_andersonii.AAC.1
MSKPDHGLGRATRATVAGQRLRRRTQRPVASSKRTAAADGKRLAHAEGAGTRVRPRPWAAKAGEAKERRA